MVGSSTQQGNDSDLFLRTVCSPLLCAAISCRLCRVVACCADQDAPPDNSDSTNEVDAECFNNMYVSSQRVKLRELFGTTSAARRLEDPGPARHTDAGQPAEMPVVSNSASSYGNKREKEGKHQEVSIRTSTHNTQTHFRINAGTPGRPGSRRLGVLTFDESVL